MKILQNKLFYITLIGWIFLFSSVFGSWFFSLFSKWTTKQNVKLWDDYIRISDADTVILWTTFANIELWEGNYNQYFYLSKSVNLIIKAELLINTNVVEMLENSLDTSAILENYISQMQNTINEMDEVSLNIQNYILETRSESMMCDNQKRTADNIFSQWIMTNEKDLIMDWMMESANNGPCYIKNRILSNWHAIVLEKMTYIKNILTRKNHIIQTNTDLILHNFLLFKNNTLEDLQQIRDELRSREFNVPIY